ncbi:MAG: hypothetical protein WCD20_01330 [Rhodomicrobium sp.]
MLFLRVFGKTLLFTAFISAAYDGARTIATPNQGMLLTSLSTHLNNYIPNGSENLARFFLANFPAFMWTYVLEPLLHLPVSAVLGALGAALFLAGYRRPPPEIIGD